MRNEIDECSVHWYVFDKRLKTLKCVVQKVYKYKYWLQCLMNIEISHLKQRKLKSLI